MILYVLRLEACATDTHRQTARVDKTQQFTVLLLHFSTVHYRPAQGNAMQDSAVQGMACTIPCSGGCLHDDRLVVEVIGRLLFLIRPSAYSSTHRRH